MMEILATGINSFLLQYTHPDQVRFILLRQASHHMRRAIDIIAIYANWDKGANTDGMLLSLDLQKAFDFISLFMFNTLWVEDQIPILQILYREPITTLMPRIHDRQ